MTRRLRVGVIGVGALGRHHARHLAQLDGTRLVGVTDIDEGRARSVAEELGTEPCALDVLLGRVEAVTIAVPTPAHAEVGLRALERGIPVLMEKPLAATLEEADQLIEAAALRGLQLQVGHIERYNRAIRAAEPYLDGPRYIESQRLAPFQPRGTDVAVVLDLMIHDLDLALALSPSQPQAATGEGAVAYSGGWDEARAEVTFVDGFTAAFDVSRTAPDRLRTMRLVYPSGEVEIDFLSHAFRNTTAYPLNADFAETRAVKDTLGTSVAAFLSAVRGEAPRPVVTAAEGAKALDLGLAVERALEAQG